MKSTFKNCSVLAQVILVCFCAVFHLDSSIKFSLQQFISACCLSPEYTTMAESLERCFNRALLKHFPSEDADTDEEFHISREDKERKDKKRNRNSKHSGPESLIKATEQVQRKRNPQGKGSTPPEPEDSRLTRPQLPPRWTNGPAHPHNLPPHQQHMFHPGQVIPGTFFHFYMASLAIFFTI